MTIPFVVIYGLSFFFTEFGPNPTTLVCLSQIFPVRVRTTAHGIAAAAEKQTASSARSRFSLSHALESAVCRRLTAAAACVVGLLVTVLMLPQSQGKTAQGTFNPALHSGGTRLVKQRHR
jgi:PHS family inorganic phosphate transporter-like MFS transporter